MAQTRRVIRILDAYIHYHADGLTITVGNTESQRETLVATGEHPFYVMGRGFTRGDELTVGQQVATHTQQPVEVLDVDLSPLELVAYNYTVEDYETYFVGEFGLWVHNVCNTSSANARRANPSKSESEVWNSSQSVGNGRRSNGERGRNREYYEWDHTHNDIEVYDYRGQHKGSKDPVTGEMYKDAVEGRTIDI